MGLSRFPLGLLTEWKRQQRRGQAVAWSGDQDVTEPSGGLVSVPAWSPDRAETRAEERTSSVLVRRPGRNAGRAVAWCPFPLGLLTERKREQRSGQAVSRSGDQDGTGDERCPGRETRTERGTNDMDND